MKIQNNKKKNSKTQSINRNANTKYNQMQSSNQEKCKKKKHTTWRGGEILENSGTGSGETLGNHTGRLPRRVTGPTDRDIREHTVYMQSADCQTRHRWTQNKGGKFTQREELKSNT